MKHLLGLLLCSMFLVITHNSQIVKYNSTTQIVGPQTYAYLPNDCSAESNTQNSNVSCIECRKCVENSSISNCTFGEVTAVCTYPAYLNCSGDRQSVRNVTCMYCYQVIPVSGGPGNGFRSGRDYECANTTTNCPSVATPAALYISQCRVKPHIDCLGNRTFFVLRPCSHTSGYKKSTAFILSVILGGLGIDRFYLRYWVHGFGKFVSFGGLGVWTLLDILFIGTGYLTPSDGSLYL